MGIISLNTGLVKVMTCCRKTTDNGRLMNLSCSRGFNVLLSVGYLLQGTSHGNQSAKVSNHLTCKWRLLVSNLLLRTKVAPADVPYQLLRSQFTHLK